MLVIIIIITIVRVAILVVLRRTVGDITDGSSDLDYSGDSKGHGNFQSGSMEASYEIDTLRLITMSFGLWGWRNNNSNGLSNTFATMPVPVMICINMYRTIEAKVPGILLMVALTTNVCFM